MLTNIPTQKSPYHVRIENLGHGANDYFIFGIEGEFFNGSFYLWIFHLNLVFGLGSATIRIQIVVEAIRRLIGEVIIIEAKYTSLKRLPRPINNVQMDQIDKFLVILVVHSLKH